MRNKLFVHSIITAFLCVLMVIVGIILLAHQHGVVGVVLIILSLVVAALSLMNMRRFSPRRNGRSEKRNG